MNSTVTVSAKQLGKRRPLFENFSVPTPPEFHGDDGVTLRDLISHIVRREVEAFRTRQAERRVFRVLSPGEIEEGAETGKIESGGSILNQPVDEEAAVDAALTAFEDEMYLAVIDGERIHSLDEQVYLKPDSNVTFVRLTLLAGG